MLARLRTWPQAPFDWEILDHAERFPANNPLGFLVVARVNKSWGDRFTGWENRRRTAKDPKFPLRADARAFAEFAATSAPLPPIPGCIDEPAEQTAVDPAELRVRGWLWDGAAQNEIVALEARIDGTLAGESADLVARPDVSAALGLAADARVGFEFVMQPVLKSGARFQLDVQARLRDGTRRLVGTRALTVADAGSSASA